VAGTATAQDERTDLGRVLVFHGIKFTAKFGENDSTDLPDCSRSSHLETKMLADDASSPVVAC
jgi:hypothetical protein